MTDTRRQRTAVAALAVGLGGALLSLGPAHAQTAPNFPTAEGQKRLAIDVTAGILYDSNIARGQNTIVQQRGVHESDVIYSPSVDVKSYVPVGRNLVFLDAAGGYDFHQFNKELENWRSVITGGGVARVGPCAMELTADYATHQSDLSDLPAQVTRNRETTTSVGTNLSCGQRKGITGFVGARTEWTTNSAQAQLVDSSLATFNAGVGYTNPRLGTLQVVGGYTRTWYDDQANILFLTQPGFESYTVGLHYSRAIGHRLHGSASIGYQQASSNDPLRTSSSTVSGAGQLEYQVNPRLGLSLAYDRSAAPATVQGFDYVINQSIDFETRYKLSSRLRATFGARWTKSDSKGLGSVFIDTPEQDHTRFLFTEFALDLSRTVAISLTANQEEREAEPSVFNYTAYQVGAKVTKSF